jgi:hypothetical protein
MATGSKPRTAEGYSADVTAACERTLLTLLGAFGTLKHTLRLVGGLVPRYLTPETPPDVPAHAGTSDVDIVLNIQLIAEGNGYASLADQLKARGFTRYIAPEGHAVSWRWTRRIDGQVSVFVEFLQEAGDHEPGKPISVDGERVSALPVKYAGIVHDWFTEATITGELLDAGGMLTDTIRIADVPSFVILKALALSDRVEHKDAADLIHVIQYAESVENVATMFVDRELSGQHPGAIDAGLNALRRLFCDDENAQGHMKVGPVRYAEFHFTGDEETKVRDQRYASGLVQNLLDLIRDGLDKRRTNQ